MKDSSNDSIYTLGLCNVYLMEAVYIVSAGRVQRLGRSFVVVGLGSVQRFPGVKQGEYSLHPLTKCLWWAGVVMWTEVTRFHRSMLCCIWSRFQWQHYRITELYFNMYTPAEFFSRCESVWQRLVREGDETRLRISGLPIGPMALPVLGRKWSGEKQPQQISRWFRWDFDEIWTPDLCFEMITTRLRRPVGLTLSLSPFLIGLTFASRT